ncbi:uncharacterized protein LOC118435436 isoform X2 [Folsomia candida]|uniref:uncharacterized protein LOC118435436 isoform X2 n=1 Tax=Folsomia candida TaxID=158441 RepID=UPI001604C252|nr:uncharacterized protein LOC118435436 isoform X2 [Folsomia candida]
MAPHPVQNNPRLKQLKMMRNGQIISSGLVMIPSPPKSRSTCRVPRFNDLSATPPTSIHAIRSPGTHKPSSIPTQLSTPGSSGTEKPSTPAQVSTPGSSGTPTSFRMSPLPEISPVVEFAPLDQQPSIETISGNDADADEGQNKGMSGPQPAPRRRLKNKFPYVNIRQYYKKWFAKPIENLLPEKVKPCSQISTSSDSIPITQSQIIQRSSLQLEKPEIESLPPILEPDVENLLPPELEPVIENLLPSALEPEIGRLSSRQELKSPIDLSDKLQDKEFKIPFIPIKKTQKRSHQRFLQTSLQAERGEQHCKISTPPTKPPRTSESNFLPVELPMDLTMPPLKEKDTTCDIPIEKKKAKNSSTTDYPRSETPLPSEPQVSPPMDFIPAQEQSTVNPKKKQQVCPQPEVNQEGKFSKGARQRLFDLYTEYTAAIMHEVGEQDREQNPDPRVEINQIRIAQKYFEKVFLPQLRSFISSAEIIAKISVLFNRIALHICTSTQPFCSNCGTAVGGRKCACYIGINTQELLTRIEKIFAKDPEFVEHGKQKIVEGYINKKYTNVGAMQGPPPTKRKENKTAKVDENITEVVIEQRKNQTVVVNRKPQNGQLNVFNKWKKYQVINID